MKKTCWSAIGLLIVGLIGGAEKPEAQPVAEPLVPPPAMAG
jgi:hypothetical protein